MAGNQSSTSAQIHSGVGVGVGSGLGVGLGVVIGVGVGLGVGLGVGDGVGVGLGVGLGVVIGVGVGVGVGVGHSPLSTTVPELRKGEASTGDVGNEALSSYIDESITGYALIVGLIIHLHPELSTLA